MRAVVVMGVGQAAVVAMAVAAEVFVGKRGIHALMLEAPAIYTTVCWRTTPTIPAAPIT
jgi:hypothetical protein